jgi:hypothetical protein
MHAISLLQRWFERNVGFMRQRRRVSLLVAVAGLLRGGTLTLTHVGRALPGKGYTKHKIKRVDRLLGTRPAWVDGWSSSTPNACRSRKGSGI